MKIIKTLSYEEMKTTLEKIVTDGGLVELYKDYPSYGNVNSHEMFIFKNSQTILDDIGDKFFVYKSFGEILIANKDGLEEYKSKNGKSSHFLRSFCYSKLRKSNKTYKEV